MTKKISCTIPQPATHYDIDIKCDLLNDFGDYKNQLSELGSTFRIITDNNVAQLYGTKLEGLLLHCRCDVKMFILPDGEQNKTRQEKARLETAMLEDGLGKDTCLIALGGGVVTDIGGYIASTYCRGIPLVMIPTTLLGMVDASIGGKNGVNALNFKNQIGTTYQPKKVWIDPLCLRTLPKKELRNGIVEMIKHGLVADYFHFEFMEKFSEQILELSPDIIEKAIFDSCTIKKEIVEQDEKESGKRRLLNFGHTIGHALETVTNYALSHGEAVAIGLMAEGHMAKELGYLHSSSFDRLGAILSKYDIPFQLPVRVSIDDILNVMLHDKKALKKVPRFVSIKEIGQHLEFSGDYCTYVPENLLRKSLQWMINDLCSD